MDILGSHYSAYHIFLPNHIYNLCFNVMLYLNSFSCSFHFIHTHMHAHTHTHTQTYIFISIYWKVLAIVYENKLVSYTLFCILNQQTSWKSLHVIWFNSIFFPVFCIAFHGMVMLVILLLIRYSSVSSYILVAFVFVICAIWNKYLTRISLYPNAFIAWNGFPGVKQLKERIFVLRA